MIFHLERLIKWVSQEVELMKITEILGNAPVETYETHFRFEPKVPQALEAERRDVRNMSIFSTLTYLSRERPE